MFPTYIDLEKVCRLCFRNDEAQVEMTSIFDRPELEQSILKCVQIKVSLSGDEPTKICERCILSLDSWSKFKLLCDNTNSFLQQYSEGNIDSDIMYNSEIMNMGSMSFTPSQLSDFSISFLENDSLWNNSITQQWMESDLCENSPNVKQTKKIYPLSDLDIDGISSEECDITLDMINTRSDYLDQAYWWNPKTISMKKTGKKKKKENEIPDHEKGISKSMMKYNRYARKTFHCTECPELFTKFSDLIAHDSVAHADLPKNFDCKTCGKLFLSKGRLEVHKNSHAEKQFACPLCSKTFSLKKTLFIHQNVHKGSFPCGECGYKAHNLYNLKMHETTHTLIKNHRCEKCVKTFSTPSSLRRHDRLVHQKSHLFRCDQCDYSTIQPSNLRHHKSCHTPQIFICQQCGSCFKNRPLYKVHLKVHESPQFSCSHCDKAFKKKSSLEVHLFNSHQIGTPIPKKTFKCDACKKTFTRAVYLRIHVNKCHPPS